MKENDLTNKGVANRIAFDGEVEANLRRHCGLICWTDPGVSPVRHVIDNGSFTFVETSNCRFLLTCSHVWQGFLKAKSDNPERRLWVSLVDDASVQSPSRPFAITNPRAIDEDTGLDLATITFDGIESLEQWRFHQVRVSAKLQSLTKGDPICFIGFTGEGIRKAAPRRLLSYSLFTLHVSDVGYKGFVIHDDSKSAKLYGDSGELIPPIRMGGASGCGIFGFSPSLKLRLVGVLTRSGASGLRHGEGYEMSDGDFYASSANAVRTDGTIRLD